MTVFEYEKTGRDLLTSFLSQTGNFKDIIEIPEQYERVDMFATFGDFGRAEFEIKTRDIKYKSFLTHILEKSKYDAILKSAEDNFIDVSYYVNFFIGPKETWMYSYNVNIIKDLNLELSSIYAPRKTYTNIGETEKLIYNLPTSLANKFVYSGGTWNWIP